MTRRATVTCLVVLLLLVPTAVAVLAPVAGDKGVAPARGGAADGDGVAGAQTLESAGGLGISEILATRNYGVGPLASVLYWADQKKACGLTRDQLAAMVMVPTFTETGAGTQYTPSPMTLSRYDNQAGLYAFKDSNTAFRKAFFHPGIGMWQFDSAGGWNLSAATAINTYTAAQTAATLMAQRWCQNPSRPYAWAPWFYCGTTSICEDLYNEIYDGTSLVNIKQDQSVSAFGGMQSRTCDTPVGTVTCYYVDPAKAEGLASWAAPNFGPAPISAPFYVFEAGGYEYRYWLPEDTGYANTITAKKPITANARTSLTWATSNELCDLTTIHGACNHGPFGGLDAVLGGGGSVLAAGWTIDPDSAASINVHVYVDGAFKVQAGATASRPDVGAAYPLFGNAHGYSVLVGGLSPGPHTVCTYGINVGAGSNMTLGCRGVTIPTGPPTGSFDLVTAGAGKVQASGWALDPDAIGPMAVSVSVDGQGTTILANLARPDIAAAFPIYGPGHGWSVVIPSVAPGWHRVCATGIDPFGGPSSLLGCRDALVPSGNPFGSVDVVTPGFASGAIEGWALDPDTAGAIVVHAYVDGVKRGEGVANLDRPDIGAAFPLYGSAHGYRVNVAPVTGGAHTVCLYGINAAAGTNALLACKSMVVSGDPGGALDGVTPAPGSVTVRGWAIDPDVTGAIQVHVYVDGTFRGVGTAGGSRSDLIAAVPGYGAGHGYELKVGPFGGGSHTVCTYGINQGGGTNHLLGCATATGSPEPIGSFDSAVTANGGSSVTVSGWAIDPDTTAADTVHVYVDAAATALVASSSRPDVGLAFPGYGNAHGFSATLTGLPVGAHWICAYGINIAGAGGNTTLGCIRT
jgi:hypothetical protein